MLLRVESNSFTINRHATWSHKMHAQNALCIELTNGKVWSWHCTDGQRPSWLYFLMLVMNLGSWNYVLILASLIQARV